MKYRKKGDYPGLALWSSKRLRWLRQAGAALLCLMLVVLPFVRQEAFAYGPVGLVLEAKNIAPAPSVNVVVIDVPIDVQSTSERAFVGIPHSLRFIQRGFSFLRLLGLQNEFAYDAGGFFFSPGVVVWEAIVGGDFGESLPGLNWHANDVAITRYVMGRCRRIISESQDDKCFFTKIGWHVEGNAVDPDIRAQLLLSGVFRERPLRFAGRVQVVSGLLEGEGEPRDKDRRNRGNQGPVTIKLEKYPTDNTDGYIVGIALVCAIGWFANRYLKRVSK